MLIVLHRLRAAGRAVARVVLDSAKVAGLHACERTVILDEPYSIDLRPLDLDDFRQKLGHHVAKLHRSSTSV